MALSRGSRHRKKCGSITQFARKVLHDKLKTVWRYAELAAEFYAEDDEYVHQLRVATRRGQAALDVFRPLLPSRHSQRVRRHLRSLRRSAGAARDLDVLLAQFHGNPYGRKTQKLTRLVSKLETHRKKVQKPLLKTVRRATPDFCDECEQLIARVTWPQRREPRCKEVASTLLAPTLGNFLSALELDCRDIEMLHELRIMAKKLRYATEILACGLDVSEWPQVHANFRKLQKRLGIVNDHATAATLFRSWSEQCKSTKQRGLLDQWAVSAQQHTDRTLDDFCTWWSKKRRAKLRKQFKRVLGDG